MKKTITTNQNGGTEVKFGKYVVTVQLSTITAPPDAPRNTISGDAFSVWMKLNDGKWIRGINPTNVMKTVEALMRMNTAQILSQFTKK